MKTVRFNFTPFSKKQLQVLSWWANPDLKDYEAIICDGSVRAGKTVVMSLSYILWSMTNFTGQQFGMAGKTIGSFRRNVLRPLRSMLESEGYIIHDSRSENMITISKNGHTNYYFIFGVKMKPHRTWYKVLPQLGSFLMKLHLCRNPLLIRLLQDVQSVGQRCGLTATPQDPIIGSSLTGLTR